MKQISNLKQSYGLLDRAPIISEHNGFTHLDW